MYTVTNYSLLDDPSPDAFRIDDEIVHAWFMENYEESNAPNMSIYKDDLFKQFTTHFDGRAQQHR